MKVLQVIAVFIAIYVAGFLTFIALLPTRPNGPLKADAIVALTGGDARLGAAVALLEHGIGKRLLITGVNKTLTKDTLKSLAHGGKRFDCCTDIGYAAEDTYGNAEEAAAWTSEHHYRSLIIVTASYHMPRSIRLFRSLMPRVRLVQYPVEPEGASRAAWWHPGMLHLLHNEFLKYLASFVMTAVDRRSADGKAPLTS
ncbi:MAG TPA: YdcF family protein [Rhizomicrobium sp.]|nr:YdcF family protein [Rhizomicrobium sp.]